MRRLAIVFALGLALPACDAGRKPDPPAPPPPVPTAPAPKPVERSPEVPVAHPAPPPVDPHEHVLLGSIRRTMCLGTCPDYTLTVYRDGKVEFDGEAYVVKTGKHAGTVTNDQLAALDKLFSDAKYLDFKDAYNHLDRTDNPSARTAYRPLGGETKTVDHYYGDSHAPESLVALEAQFDEIVKSERWVGTRAQREKLQR